MIESRVKFSKEELRMKRLSQRGRTATKTSVEGKKEGTLNVLHYCAAAKAKTRRWSGKEP